VALKEYKAEKIYYTMGEVTEMFDVNASLIRFWEQRFDVLKPDKNKKGNRLFTPSDIRNLEIIYHLVKERGMTLAGADKYLKANKKELERDTEIVRRLQTIRSLLAEIREELTEPAAGTRVIVAPDPDWGSRPAPPAGPEVEPEPELPVEEGFSDQADSFGLYGQIASASGAFPLDPEPDDGEPFDAGVSEPFTVQSLFDLDDSPEPFRAAEPEAGAPSPADLQPVDTQQSLF
jgi:DNA-binding transcriptional MerR regulator